MFFDALNFILLLFLPRPCRKFVVAAAVNRTEREMNRRQDMLNKLSVKAGEVAPTLNMSMSADRDSLFGLDRNRGDIMKIANDLDNHDLVGFQRQIIKGM